MTQTSVNATNSSIDQIAFGGGTIAGPGRGVSEDTAKDVISAAYDHGVRFFDTASMYAGGKSEELLGEVLSPMRSSITLLTKGGVSYPDLTNLLVSTRDSSYDALRRSLEGSLGRLRTDAVDVFLLHQFDHSRTPEEAMENLQHLVDDGLTRHVGFCNFGANAFRRAMATGIPTFVEYSFSLLDRRYANELQQAADAGCRRLSYGTFVHGLLAEQMTADTEFPSTDWRNRSRTLGNAVNSGNVFYAGDAFAENVRVADELREIASRLGVSLAVFVLALIRTDPLSDLTLIGCRTVAELEENLSALRLDLDEQTRAQAGQILDSVKRPTQNTLDNDAP